MLDDVTEKLLSSGQDFGGGALGGTKVGVGILNFLQNLFAISQRAAIFYDEDVHKFSLLLLLDLCVESFLWFITYAHPFDSREPSNAISFNEFYFPNLIPKSLKCCYGVESSII